MSNWSSFGVILSNLERLRTDGKIQWKTYSRIPVGQKPWKSYYTGHWWHEIKDVELTTVFYIGGSPIRVVHTSSIAHQIRLNGNMQRSASCHKYLLKFKNKASDSSSQVCKYARKIYLNWFEFAACETIYMILSNSQPFGERKQLTFQLCRIIASSVMLCTSVCVCVCVCDCKFCRRHCMHVSPSASGTLSPTK